MRHDVHGGLAPADAASAAALVREAATPVDGYPLRDGERVEVWRGGREIARQRRALEQLSRRCGAPATARPGWVQATLDVAPDQAAWAVTIKDDRNRVVAAALLLDVRAGAAHLVTLAGSAVGQRGALLVTELHHADVLGRSVGAELLSRTRMPYVDLSMLPAGDPRVELFALGLPDARVVAEAPIPVIRLDQVSDAWELYSNNMRRQLRKATNRLATDGLTPQIDFTGDGHEIDELIPGLVGHHRERDHAHGRSSHLDDIPGVLQWESRLRSLAAEGVLEMGTLRLADELAAYTFGIVDGDTYRLLEGRFVSKWSRYSPGRILEGAVVQRTLDDPDLHTLDWMSAVADEKLLAANDTDPVVAIRMSGS
jgi:CelD/BcsL family acetyltransferase involved in cellulose biosynthesis